MLKMTKQLLKLTKSRFKITELRRLSIKSFDDHFKITFINSGNYSHLLYYFWLRDHCGCGECINRITLQKSYHILDIPFDIKPIQYEIKEKNLSINWNDGHSSVFSLKWLKSVQQSFKGQREYLFWNRDSGSSISNNSVTLSEIRKNKTKCQIKLLKSLLKYGFAFITGIEPSLNATENAISTFFPIYKTHFGEMWQVTDNFFHKDTAYTNTFLTTHTDNTYWTEASGLIAFHMLSYNGTGGSTLLVDGFNAATNLKNKSPHFYDILTKSLHECEYVEEGVHFSNIDYIIKHHPLTNDLWQIRFNVYDRAVLKTLPSEKIMHFYKAYRAFAEEIVNKNSELRIKLTPGTIILIDNWRVMHGREAFTGERILGGCYVSRADWLSKAKSLGLFVF